MDVGLRHVAFGSNHLILFGWFPERIDQPVAFWSSIMDAGEARPAAVDSVMPPKSTAKMGAAVKAGRARNGIICFPVRMLVRDGARMMSSLTGVAQNLFEKVGAAFVVRRRP